MNKGRMEAFSDGVVAILITIMILELRPPDGIDLASLRPIVPPLSAYVLSYVFIGIYWNNHHHMLQATNRVTGAVLWANLHFLFWLSLVPFATAWLGHFYSASLPTALYGAVLLMCGVAYTILQQTIISEEGYESRLATAVGMDRKALLSVALYMVAIPIAFVRPWISDACFITVALMWLVPDSRIEKRLSAG